MISLDKIVKKSEISLNIEFAPVLYKGMQDYIKNNPKWDRNSLITASLDLFLMQNAGDIESKATSNHGNSYIQAICENSNDSNTF